MGKTKSHVESELTFAPKISDNSRKLALLKIYEQEQLSESGGVSNRSDGQDDSAASGVPHFMKSTVSRRESVVKDTDLAPLKKVPLNLKGKIKKLSLSKKISKVKRDDSPAFNNLTLKIAKEKGAKIHAEIMAKAATMPTTTNSGRVVDDSETFTFKPKVSSRSASIAESLGTDFMARNQQHIEKQKKLLDQSHNNHRTINPYTGRLSPVVSSSNPKSNKKASNKEGATNSLAWGTPDSTKILTAPNTNSETDGSPARVTRSGTTLSPIKHPSKSQSSVSIASKSLAESPYSSSNAGLIFKKSNPKAILKKSGGSDSGYKVQWLFKDTDDDDIAPQLSRSKTMPPPSNRRLSKKSISGINLDRLKNAKMTAEKAIKHRKIFTIQGPYAIVRKSLRKRGWVEKFYKPSQAPQKKTPRTSKSKDKNNDSDDDDDDDDDDNDDPVLDAMKNDENAVPPWEEEGGIYGIMSRIVRNCSPTFIWCIRRDAIDYRFLNKDQMVNHYCRAGSFTTKVGLCVNLRNVSWFDNANSQTFFPRCYKLSMDEEKNAFIDDFRLTACQSIIRHVIERYGGRSSPGSIAEEEEPPKDEPEEADKMEGDKEEGKSPSTPRTPRTPRTPSSRAKKQQCTPVGMRIIDQALQQCERWLGFKAHMDIDRWDDPHLLSDSAWDQLIQSYYRIINDGATITNATSRVQECEVIASKLRRLNSQFDMDGSRNVWIVKPGAKSRGRGIMVYDNLEEMCKLVSSSVVTKEGKYVVQKYIERPLLVYNTKFDIRQWFLVTDWNPLTIWFYKECYLRFCSQQFTLENFNEAIHLSNFSIQKHYSNGPRSKSLPRDNMWDSETFKQFLSGKGQGQAWEEKIYPGMKKSVICSLLSTQDVVEYRKSSFELYGADFMLTDDLNPWLIEINSSPTMSASTPVTTRLCHNVIEDTMKVVIDRKYDKNCDTGDFELAFKQNPVSIPPYIGINLSVEGQSIRKPYSAFVNKNPMEDNPYLQKQSPPKPINAGKTAPSSAPSQSQTLTPIKLGMTHSKTPPNNSTKDNATSNSSIKKEKDSKPSSNSSSKQDNSKGDLESGSVKESSITSSKTESKKSHKVSLDHKVLLVEREKLPMKMTHVAAADFKPVKMGNKGTGPSFSDRLKTGRPCTLCGNGMSLHLDSNNVTCKCRQDSLCIGLSHKRVRSAHAPTSARSQALMSARSPSVTVPRGDHHHILAAVYNRGPSIYDINASRRVLGYTDGGIKRPKSPLHISPKALPNLIRRMQSRKNGLVNVAPMYQHSREYSLVRSTFPYYPKS